jgi:hypothetical protein
MRSRTSSSVRTSERINCPRNCSGAFQQCDNAEIGVDGHRRLIVAASVQQSASDALALIPIVDQAKKNVRRCAKVVLADAGYASETDLKAHPDARSKRQSAQDPLPTTPTRIPNTLPPLPQRGVRVAVFGDADSSLSPRRAAAR